MQSTPECHHRRHDGRAWRSRGQVQQRQRRDHQRSQHERRRDGAELRDIRETAFDQQRAECVAQRRGEHHASPEQAHRVAADVQPEQHHHAHDADHQTRAGADCLPARSDPTRWRAAPRTAGSAAISKPASDEVTCCSPDAISRKGAAISITASATRARQRPRRWTKAPRAAASGTSTIGRDRRPGPARSPQGPARGPRS